jgi:hypothetical protein
MASNKREMYAERKGRCEGGEKVGGVFFRKQPRKDKREPPKHELHKIGDGRGGGGRGGRRDTEIIVLRY